MKGLLLTVKISYRWLDNIRDGDLYGFTVDWPEIGRRTSLFRSKRGSPES